MSVVFWLLLFQPHLKSEIRACGLSVNQMRVKVVFVTVLKLDFELVMSML